MQDAFVCRARLTDGLVRWIQNTRPSIPVIVASGDVGKANDARRLHGGECFCRNPLIWTRRLTKFG